MNGGREAPVFFAQVGHKTGRHALDRSDYGMLSKLGVSILF